MSGHGCHGYRLDLGEHQFHSIAVPDAEFPGPGIGQFGIGLHIRKVTEVLEYFIQVIDEQVDPAPVGMVNRSTDLLEDDRGISKLQKAF